MPPVMPSWNPFKASSSYRKHTDSNKSQSVKTPSTVSGSFCSDASVGSQGSRGTSSEFFFVQDQRETGANGTITVVTRVASVAAATLGTMRSLRTYVQQRREDREFENKIQEIMDYLRDLQLAGDPRVKEWDLKDSNLHVLVRTCMELGKDKYGSVEAIDLCYQKENRGSPLEHDSAGGKAPEAARS